MGGGGRSLGCNTARAVNLAHAVNFTIDDAQGRATKHERRPLRKRPTKRTTKHLAKKPRKCGWIWLNELNGLMTPISFSATNHLAAPKLFLLKADPASMSHKSAQ